MVPRIYRALHRFLSRKTERGSYSSGYLQARIREAALDWCVARQGALLEVGCGEGLFLEALLKRSPGMLLNGVDMDQGRVLEAQKRCAVFQGADISLQTGGALRFPDAAFESVVCINVFLNCTGIEQVRAMIAEMVRVCRPGGRILVEFRNSRHLLQKMKFRLAPLYDPTVRGLPLRTYSREEIDGCFRGLSCRVLAARSLGGRGLRAPVFLTEAEKM